MPVPRTTTPRDGAPDRARRAEAPRTPGTARRNSTTPARTRTSAAWVGACVGVLVLVMLVIFMLQNTAPVEVAFLGMSGAAPLALVLLIAGLGVGIVVLTLGGLRIAQLRRRLKSDRTEPAMVRPRWQPPTGNRPVQPRFER